MSSNSTSSKANSSAASTHSTISTATTISGVDVLAKKHKWYSLSSKSLDNTADVQRKALHNEALANYFSTR
ncbi:hypothetical protein N7457_001175 [Penicillium paradoxum]|uniref:uncharacterized protein n=1 Tax=Penicillium paradoxum TaxID=176176 RepID=UPI0025482A9C|nr:uncharacterized protein N7457_001175 [Penicillium paradoxum]KAJ5794576.1 hypothetical protein N7457_001175 [Penicillium paradoxum]